jgi:hypothetical protein
VHTYVFDFLSWCNYIREYTSFAAQTYALLIHIRYMFVTFCYCVWEIYRTIFYWWLSKVARYTCFWILCDAGFIWIYHFLLYTVCCCHFIALYGYKCSCRCPDGNITDPVISTMLAISRLIYLDNINYNKKCGILRAERILRNLQHSHNKYELDVKFQWTAQVLIGVQPIHIYTYYWWLIVSYRLSPASQHHVV